MIANEVQHCPIDLTGRIVQHVRPVAEALFLASLAQSRHHDNASDVVVPHHLPECRRSSQSRSHRGDVLLRCIVEAANEIRVDIPSPGALRLRQLVTLKLLKLSRDGDNHGRLEAHNRAVRGKDVDVPVEIFRERDQI
jgi:hypothetical protein